MANVVALPQNTLKKDRTLGVKVRSFFTVFFSGENLT